MVAQINTSYGDTPKAITIPHYVGGRRLIGSAERSGAVFNPATGETSGRVAFASPEEVRAAVETAAAAASGWAATTPLRRARILNRFLRILEERTD